MTALKFTLLGCGDSAGVPRIGGDWGQCDPKNPKNRRTRPSLLVQSATTTLVIDTGPDFSAQLTREAIKTIDAVLYTHWHSDHIAGIDDLRIISLRDGKHIPIYGDEKTLSNLALQFPYLFREVSPIYPVTLASMIIPEEAMGQKMRIGDISFIPFVQDHGQGGKSRSLGFRFGDVAYSTDMRDLDEQAISVLRGVKTWIADCADYSQGAGLVHMTFPMLEKMNARVQAEKVYLTHLKMFSDYQTLCDELPEGYAPCYDGLVLTSC